MKDLTGLWFGHLQAVKPLPKKNGNTRWLCKCDCGKECAVFTYNLTSGRTKSCGCQKGTKQIWSKLKNENLQFLKLIEELQEIAKTVINSANCSNCDGVGYYDGCQDIKCGDWAVRKILEKINEVLK